MDHKQFVTWLQKHHACDPAIEWVIERGYDLSTVWIKCERGDWLLWLAVRLKTDHKKIVRAACKCARLALPYLPKGETMPLNCIRTTERWTVGKATIEEVLAAAAATYAAAAATYAAAAAADAAAAAAAATYATAAAAVAAAAAAAAADAATDAATYAAAADAAAAAAAAATYATAATTATATAAAAAADAAAAAARVEMHRRCANAIRRVIPTIAAGKEE